MTFKNDIAGSLYHFLRRYTFERDLQAMVGFSFKGLKVGII